MPTNLSTRLTRRKRIVRADSKKSCGEADSVRDATALHGRGTGDVRNATELQDGGTGGARSATELQDRGTGGAPGHGVPGAREPIMRAVPRRSRLARPRRAPLPEPVWSRHRDGHDCPSQPGDRTAPGLCHRRSRCRITMGSHTCRALSRATRAGNRSCPGLSRARTTGGRSRPGLFRRSTPVGGSARRRRGPEQAMAGQAGRALAGTHVGSAQIRRCSGARQGSGS